MIRDRFIPGFKGWMQRSRRSCSRPLPTREAARPHGRVRRSSWSATPHASNADGASTERDHSRVTVVPPDYDSDPERWRSWESPRDVHDMIAAELGGPLLDIGCGEGRLASLLGDGVSWIGVDSSAAQLAANPHRPVVLADMSALPFRDDAFAEVTHLWCLYHLDHPPVAIAEARRVLRAGGRYFASTAARDNDPEIMFEGYPPSTFDAEDAVAIVAAIFDSPEPERWDGPFFPLETREEVRAYCRHNYIPEARAQEVDVPLWLTKRGVLVRATK